MLKGLIESHGCRSICEVGAGANPALPLDHVTTRGLQYCLLDLAPEELGKAPAGYEKILADISSGTTPPGGPFDLVVTRMLAEHVRRPRQFHRNVRSLLRPGGLAFHFFPTLYALPFVANRVLPERASAAALRLLSPRDPFRQRKFPAYYHWCRGPTAAQTRRFERLGYVVEEYVGFFGHGYYERIPVLRGLHRMATGYLLRHPVPLLTSFAYLILRKTNTERTEQ
jgi:SAM-dependent methyltransferase